MEKVICTVCPKGCHMKVEIEEKKVEGNSCKRGEIYGLAEVVNPIRVITSTIDIKGGQFKKIPVKTLEAVEKGLNFKIIEEMKKIKVKSPIKCGTVVIENILGTGVDVVVTRDM